MTDFVLIKVSCFIDWMVDSSIKTQKKMLIIDVSGLHVCVDALHTS